jgi:hypothetical protein
MDRSPTFEQETGRNVRRRLNYPEKEREELEGDAPISAIGAPAFVVQQGHDQDDYFPSDDEEFNNLEELYEITDEDRIKREPIVLPPHTHLEELNVEQRVQWAMDLVQTQLQRQQASECLKRKTLAKLLRRFEHKEMIEQQFYDILLHLSNSFAPLPQRPHGPHGESFSDICDRHLMTGLNLYDNSIVNKYRCYQAAVLYYIYRKYRRALVAPNFPAASFQGQLQAFATDVRQQAVNFLNDLMPVLPRAVAAAEEEESPRARERALLNFRKALTDLVDTTVTQLYRISLFQHFQDELDNVLQQIDLMAQKFKGYGMELPLPLHCIALSIVPTYNTCPVRGPFKPHFKGNSVIQQMYGPKPNPNFWYCNCRVNGDVCGHIGIVAYRARPIYFFR